MMIDTHCHILPAIDDGPADWDQSLQLARQLSSEGITQVIATPHQLGRFDQSSESDVVRGRVTELNCLLVEHQIPLTVYPGAEVYLDERIPRFLQQDRILTLSDGKRHLLLELFPEFAVDILPLLSQLREQGVFVILAHAERYDYLVGDRGRLNEWIAEGVALQLTTIGLAGKWNRRVKDNAWQLLMSGNVSLIASDAHDCGLRQPFWGTTYQAVSGRIGSGLANRLFVENPQRILDGQRILSLFEHDKSRQPIVEIPAPQGTQPALITTEKHTTTVD